jgi:hypothetical protein
MSDEETALAVPNQQPGVAVMSLTADIKEFLMRSRAQAISGDALAGNPLDSVYDAAEQHGMTLIDYIHQYPNTAVRIAERNLANWTRVVANAALTGVINTEDSGAVKVNKNISDLLAARVEAAQKALDSVITYAMSAVGEGALRKDQVIQTLYNRAVIKGDTRALMYLIDRIEGRVGEQQITGLDFSNAANVYNILCTMFDKQLEVLNSGPGTKIICCSRRSGKTHLAAALCLIECLRVPGVTCLYVGKTMELAEGLLFGAMNLIIDTCHLKDSKGHRLNFKKFDNGSNIMIRGLSNTKDPDMIRGHKAKVIIIDEFFHITEDGLLEYMMQEVLEPMQMDFATDHRMLLIGTPPKIKGTFGEKMWYESKVPHFKWTFRDNPYPIGQDKEAYVESKLLEKGLDWTSPYAQREYGGEFVYDADALLIPEFKTYSPDTFTPQLTITNVYCGLDYGVSDSTALVGIAWDAALRRGFVFFESKFNRLQVDKGISMLEHLKREVLYLWEMAFDFFPNYTQYEANKRIYWDADTSDKTLTDELKYNVHMRTDAKLVLQIADAHKTDKILMHDKMRDLLRTGALLLPEGSKIVQECEKTIMKRDDKGNILPEVDERYYHPDLLPSLRYALWNAVGLEVTNAKQGVDMKNAHTAPFIDGNQYIHHNNTGEQKTRFDGHMDTESRMQARGDERRKGGYTTNEWRNRDARKIPDAGSGTDQVPESDE